MVKVKVNCSAVSFEASTQFNHPMVKVKGETIAVTLGSFKVQPPYGES